VAQSDREISERTRLVTFIDSSPTASNSADSYQDGAPPTAALNDKKSSSSESGFVSRSQSQKNAKTFFANERTLLSWLNTVTFLAMAGLMVFDIESDLSRWAGLSLIGLTVLFAAYALFTFQRRLNSLKGSTKVSFADKLGPPMLIVCFCVVLVCLALYYTLKDIAY
jgi:uncharacterized membrane protein YidH (DUF202 family)